MIPLAHDAPRYASRESFGKRFDAVSGCVIVPAVVLLASSPTSRIAGYGAALKRLHQFMRRETAIQIVGHSNVTCEQSNPSSDRPVSTWSSMRANEYLHLPDSSKGYQKRERPVAIFNAVQQGDWNGELS